MSNDEKIIWVLAAVGAFTGLVQIISYFLR